MKNIALIGSGNVATHLGLSLVDKGYTITQVWSKKLENADILAKKLNSTATNYLKNIKKADLYIVAVKDDSLESIIGQLNVNNIVHTSGSIGLEVFENKFENYGVFYPLQTFNKDMILEFQTIPICIEANNEIFNNKLLDIGDDLSKRAVIMSSEQRKQLHIAAIFACNFTNHMFTIANTILTKSNIDFKLLLPIIKQTVIKINNNKPSVVQTGPAKRQDKKIIQSHIENLSDKKIKEIYKLISESIMTSNE
jgi:predicted short-subunit dehydrogenase-like oxidoreductase (DUF2520 family)